MSLSAGKSRLATISKDLSIQWAQTQEHWADAKSQEFDQKYMEELRSSVDAAITVIEQLDQLVTKIRSDCE